VNMAPDESVALLWRDLHARVEAFVRRRVPAEVDPEDVVQDVFLRLHAGLGDGRVADPEAFVYKSARNAVVDAYRRQRPTEPEAEIADEGVEERAGESLAGCVNPFVERLPEPYREALRLTDLGGLSQAEAAAQVGISASGMRTRVQRGRERLRALFDACCQFELDRRGGIVSYESRCGC